MNFLSNKSLHLYQDILPDMASILTSRIINYLSFYNSFNGKHQYYSPYLYSHDYLQRFFSNTSSQAISKYNYDHLLAKALISVNFHEQVMDAKGTYRFLTDLYELNQISKKDIVQSLLKVKCASIYKNQPIQLLGTPLPIQKRRNIYVSYGKILPKQQQLTQIITLNPFYRIPNINKILVFTSDPNNTLRLSKDLQLFCHQNSIKIKLFDKSSNMQTLIQYLYTKNKNKILIHENINFQKQIYDIQTPPQKQRTVNKKVVNPLYTRLMPQQIIVMTQRLPFQSLATKQNEKQTQQKMRSLLGIEREQNLVDPIKRIAMENIQVGFNQCRQFQFKQGQLQTLANDLVYLVQIWLPYASFYNRLALQIQQKVQIILKTDHKQIPYLQTLLSQKPRDYYSEYLQNK